MDQEDHGNGAEAIAVVRQENGKCYMAVDMDMKQCGYRGGIAAKAMFGAASQTSALAAKEKGTAMQHVKWNTGLGTSSIA